MRDLLHETADHAADFLESLPERPVFPQVDAGELRARLGGPVPEGPTDAREVVAELAAVGSEAAVAIPGPRYFGFVIGGALPASLAADWLTSTWDQNAGLYVAGPAAAVVEEIAGAWLADLLRLPRATSFAFVTGTQMAHATAMAAARNHVLAERRLGRGGEGPDRRAADPRLRRREGALDLPARAPLHRPWHRLDRADPGRRPGPDASRRAPRGACRPRRPGDRLREGRRGEHGSFDDFHAIADAAEAAGAWLHVDGAFGLWAAASPRFAHLVDGAERADSWATDGTNF